MRECDYCGKEIASDRSLCGKCEKGLKETIDSVDGWLDDIFEEEKSTVNHPKHYNYGRIEVIDFIEDQKLDYHCGNAVKYICRAGRKNANIIEDYEKAIWYLQREIKYLKSGLEVQE